MVASAGARELSTTLQVTEPAGVGRTGWPVTTGVPFPPGMVRDVSMLTLREAGSGPSAHSPVPLQVRALSRWSDGSVRWALLDWRTDLAARQQRNVVLGVGAAGKAPSSSPVGIKLRDLAERIEVDTGPLQFAVPKKSFALLTDVRVDGRAAMNAPAISFLSIDAQRLAGKTPSKIVVTESGPQRVRIELRGDYSAEFGYIIRIDAFAGQPFVRILHTFEQHGPQPYTSVSQIALEVPLARSGAQTYVAGQEQAGAWTGILPPGGFTLYQEDNEAFHLNGTRQLGRIGGWVGLRTATAGAVVAGRFVWQEYPQSFHLREGGITYNLWAPEAPAASVGMGAAKTHEAWLLFHGKTAPGSEAMRVLTQPVLARVDAEWIAQSGALPNSIASGTTTAPFLHELEAAHRRYEASIDSERWDDSGQVFCSDPARQRQRRGFYGMFNWGDWNYPGYHDTTKGCDAWGNLEYDTSQVLALAYAATGQRAFYEGLIAAARHFMDVDRIYYQSAHPNWVGMNHPKNPLHFAFELGGVDLGHTWTEGLLSYYYLTGDDRGLEAARAIADYLVIRLVSGFQRGNPRQWGWPQIALVAVYEATGSEGYRSAALEYARRGMAAYPPDDVTHWKMGIFAEALSYTHAATQDAAIRAWLENYARVVSNSTGAQDARFAPALAYMARLTGNADYARVAQAALARPQFGNWGKPFTIAGRLGFRILALTPAVATQRHAGTPAKAAHHAGAPAATPPSDTWDGLKERWNPTPEAWHPMPDPFGR